MKIVVFDLDETLGYFTQFGIFWDCLNNYVKRIYNYNLTQHDFNHILDLYPEFLRPNIINILNYLKNKKHTKCCHKMMIYTNNQGPKEWAHHIVSYFESKIKYRLFDQIISAFKINGKRVEICRSSHDKTHEDFIKCTKIPINAEICFLDDSFYPEMANDNIYYINLKPYYHDLKFEEMIVSFKNSEIGKMILNNHMTDENNYEKQMIADFTKYKYEIIEKKPDEYEIDKILGKQIMTHLHMFFNKSSKNKSRSNNQGKTRKHMANKRNKTLKQ